MSKLRLSVKDGQPVVEEKELTLDSREVAEMVGKRHSDLLRDIEVYISYLCQNAKLRYEDFFKESSYKAGTGKEYKCYQVTKKGCEFIAHKLTGQKGTLFTATYINRFHEMESTIKQQQTKITSLTKQQEVEARLKNAKVREANIYLKIADKVQIPEYKQIMYSKATEVLSGEQLLPLPKSEKRTFTAAEIGNKLGITSNMVGRLANKNNLKTNEYGVNVWDKAKHCDKQVPTFRYYENVISVLRELLKEVK
ncbi:Rha family transcriptional regulator [Clostridium tetani]|uniref:Rha family transcriptional regulator n=1 Tax=Clostridium tetani TaxID=1513 RepID=UPI00068B2FFA|nr:Rha family transcriptional regulator [Clostridium tetani]